MALSGSIEISAGRPGELKLNHNIQGLRSDEVKRKVTQRGNLTVGRCRKLRRPKENVVIS